MGSLRLGLCWGTRWQNETFPKVLKVLGFWLQLIDLALEDTRVQSLEP